MFQTNYATDYALAYYMFNVFSSVWEELGYSWEGFLEWSEKKHIPAMQVTHVENDQAENVAKRLVSYIPMFKPTYVCFSENLYYCHQVFAGTV